MARETLVTLAERLGVSRTTVSNAFSRPGQLSPRLRERILAAARDAGYDGPSAAAASLRTGRTDTVGVLFTDSLAYAFSDPVATRFLSGVAGEVEEAAFGLTVVSSPRGGKRSALSKAMLDGLIVYSVDDDSPALPAARRRGIPMVLVDQPPEPGLGCVNIDDRGGAAVAVVHLAGLGHRRLGAVAVAAGPPQCAVVEATAASRNHVVRERMVGWREAAHSAGLAAPLTISCPVNAREHGRHAARLLLDAPVAPTGIVCLSDELALGVIAELAASGVRVPEEVSVVGYDDSPAGALASPPLTTVHQASREKGRRAAELLMARLGAAGAEAGAAGREPGAAGAEAHVVLPTYLVERASTSRAGAAPAVRRPARPASPRG